MIQPDLLRRYTQVSAEGVIVKLDDRELLTPDRRSLDLPSAALAEAIAQEWQAQGEKIGDKINPAAMPMTQLAFTAIDRVRDRRDLIIDELLNYLETELICHYGDDPGLIAHQKKHWQALHDWLQTDFGVTLPVTVTIQPLQAVQDHAWAVGFMQALDPFRLTALQQAVAVSTSLVIGMALTAGKITAGAALDAAEVEADYQAEKWGRDPEFVTRRMGQLTDFEAVEKFLALLQS